MKEKKAQAGTSTLTTLIVIVLAAFMIVGFISFVYDINPIKLYKIPEATKQNFESIISAFKTTDTIVTVPAKDTDTYAVFDQDHAFIKITKDDGTFQYLAKPSACGVLMACVLYCPELSDIEGKGEEFFCVQPITQRFVMEKGLKTSTQLGGIIIVSNELQIENNGVRVREEGHERVGYTKAEYEQFELDTSMIKGLGESFLRVLVNRFDLEQDFPHEELQSMLDVIFKEEEVHAVEISVKREDMNNVGLYASLDDVCLKLFDEKNEQIFPQLGGHYLFTDDCIDSKNINRYHIDSAPCVGYPMRFARGEAVTIDLEYGEETVQGLAGEKLVKKYTAKCISP